MSVPNYEELMRPVLEASANGEVRIGDVINDIAIKLKLSSEDLTIMLPSGKQTRFANRVHWAKSYLKQAGLVRATRRGHFIITDRGTHALSEELANINEEYLTQFEEFQEFKTRKGTSTNHSTPSAGANIDLTGTPDEALREAHQRINASLASDLVDRIREASPAFFEQLLVKLLLAMGYGGTSEGVGEALVIGGPGDDGIDGVIDQDPLGLDRVYIQAKRYKEGNKVGPDAIRNFSGSLDIHNAQKGLFVTASNFTDQALKTAEMVNKRIVLIDGLQLAHLMLQHNIGCHDQDVLHLKKISEDFFEE